jgi:UDP-N-acetylglucosamine--N-acetylmuramyl-(pentapeptide) pyrophosphoryl-undecaprenol N-acetylglucosamine transferase
MKAFSRILLTGGGTAGHVNPALAIGRALGDERTTYLYVGVRGRAEAEIVPREGIPIRFVRAAAYPGARPSLAWLGFAFNLVAGTARALVIVQSVAPEIIVGTGGYASAPTMLAAAILRRLGLLSARVYVHEQNAAPGKLNLLVGRLADRVFVSFRHARRSRERRHGRLPAAASSTDREAARAAWTSACRGPPVVFAFGS